MVDLQRVRKAWWVLRGQQPLNFDLDPAPRASDLFSGNADLFLEALETTKRYGEYGVGESTVFAAADPERSVVAIDSDASWISRVGKVVDEERVALVHVDIGPVGDWGRPLDYRNRSAFAEYPSSLWNLGSDFDLVLIDGRFRVACLLRSLLEARPGTKLLFDDYCTKPWYHVVEEVIRPIATNGRQALFICPPSVPELAVESMLQEFQFVAD